MKKSTAVVLLAAATAVAPTAFAEGQQDQDQRKPAADAPPDADSGIAAGSANSAASFAAGSTTIKVLVGLGTAAVIGAVVAGSSSKGSTGTTSTTSTH